MVLLKIDQVTKDATLNMLLGAVNAHMQEVTDRWGADHFRELEGKSQVIKSLRNSIDLERSIKESLKTQLVETNVKLSKVTAERDDYIQVETTYKVNLWIVVASVIVTFVSLGWAVYSS